MPIGPICLIARAKLSRYVSDLKQTSAPEKFTGLVKAGYLFNLGSAERNLVGAIGQTVADRAAHEMTVAIDYGNSLIRSAVTGGKIKPHEFREVASALNRQGGKAFVQGLKKGWGDFKDMMRTGVNIDDVAEKFDHPRTHYDTPALQWLQQKIFDYYNASDRPGFEVTKHISMSTRIRVAGIRSGLKGKALDAHVEEGMRNPTPDVVLGANYDAGMVMYKNQTALAKVASGARRALKQTIDKAEPGQAIGAKAGIVALDLTMPFTKIAGAVQQVAVDYSPMGFVKAVAYSMDKNPAIQRELIQRLSKATIGTGLLLWGYKSYKAGNATGSRPTKQGDQLLWEQEGKDANQVRIGDEWHSINILGPMAIPYLIGANVAAAEETDLMGKARLTAAFMGKSFTEMSFMTGVKGMVDAFSDPEHKGASAMSRLVFPAPAIVGQAAKAVDPVRRKAAGVGQQIQKRIPFASKRLPAELTAFGDTVKMAGGGWRAFGDPTRGQTSTEDDLTRELDLEGVNPGQISPTVTINGKKVKRTQEEMNALTSEFGPIKKAVLTQIIGDPSFKTLDPDEKKKVLEGALRDITQAANDVDKARRSGERVPKMTVEEFFTGAAR